MHELVESLFKYRPINKDTIDSIVNNYLFFNSVNNFNDPFDCQVRLKYRGTNTDFELFFKRYRKIFNNSEEKKKCIENLRTGKFHDTGERFTRIEDIKVCCLSKINNDKLMWGHYADSYKGICIEYKTHNLQNIPYNILRTSDGYYAEAIFKDFMRCVDVNYTDKFPNTFNPILDNEKELYQFFLTKAECWDYEKECRIIALDQYLLKGPKVKLIDDSIKAIYFGVNAENKNIKTVVELFRGRNVPKFYRSKIANSEYKIEFAEIKMA